MPNYYRMNKILKEERTMEISAKEETDFTDSESHRYISELETQDEADAIWQMEYYK